MCICNCFSSGIRVGDGFHVHKIDPANSDYSGVMYICEAVDSTVVVGRALSAGLCRPASRHAFLKDDYIFSKLSCKVTEVLKQNLK